MRLRLGLFAPGGFSCGAVEEVSDDYDNSLSASPGSADRSLYGRNTDDELLQHHSLMTVAAPINSPRTRHRYALRAARVSRQWFDGAQSILLQLTYERRRP